MFKLFIHILKIVKNSEKSKILLSANSFLLV